MYGTSLYTTLQTLNMLSRPSLPIHAQTFLFWASNLLVNNSKAPLNVGSYYTSLERLKSLAVTVKGQAVLHYSNARQRASPYYQLSFCNKFVIRCEPFLITRFFFQAITKNKPKMYKIAKFYYKKIALAVGKSKIFRKV